MSSTQTVNGFDIETLLVAESGRIGSDIYRRTINTTPWLKLVKQDAWPDQMGETISVLTYERTMPTSAQTWATVGNTSDSQFCIPPATNIPVAQTLRTYNLVHTAVESDPICINDVRLSFRFREQLRNVYENLVENVGFLWKERFRSEYSRLAEHKMVAGVTSSGALSDNTAAFSDLSDVLGGEAGVSKLTQGILNRVYMNLVRDGAGNKPMGRANGAPVFTLVTSAETSDQIIHDNSASGNRDDLRWGEPSELLKPLGVERSYRGFYHVIDPFPPRYNFSSGTWVEVPAYVEDPNAYTGKQGSTTRYVVNPAYETAEYEDSFVLIPDVFTALIPRPLSDAGSGVRFNPTNYRGKFDWKNIEDRVENPDKSWGYFRGVLSHGSKPVHPEWGYVIRHKRCDERFLLLDCADALINGSTAPGSWSTSASS